MILDKQKIWSSVLTNLELNISKANFNTWFKETALKDIDNNGTAYVIVPNQFVKNWIAEKFNSTILKYLIDVVPEIRNISYVIEKIKTEKQSEPKIIRKNPVKNTAEGGKALSLEINSVNNQTNLNPKYDFNNFVVGSFNEVAFTAASVVANKKEVVYNPLLIYGNTGYGKTHLIQAVGNHIKNNSSDKKVYYTTSERFYMDVIDFIGLKSNKTNNFKQKYRQYDVLIMDDIQFLSKKERTQEELFHLFNYLYDNNKQIILSSDQHPNQIPDLEDRLRSRFNAGMIIDIQTPDFESRVEILKKKTALNNFSLHNDVIEHIASVVTGNIRELEGVLNNIFIQSEIKGRELSLPEVKDIIKSNFKKKNPIDYKKLVKIVSEYFNIDENNIYKKVRKKEFVKPRQVAMYLLREDFSLSYPAIGEKLGGRDHTTVMHSYEKVKDEIKNNPDLKKDLEIIRTMY